MKLAFVTATLSNAGGGLATAVSATAAALSQEADFDVHIVGTRDRADPSAWCAWGDNVHAHSTYGPAVFNFAPGVRSTLDRLAADITDLQGLWVYPSLAHLMYQRRCGQPFVVTPHGMLDPWALRRSPWKKKTATFCFEGTQLRLANCLRATAAMEADQFRSFGLRQPIAVISNGVNIPVAGPAPGVSEARRLLFLSRLHPKKGISILLRAWATLQKLFPEWELVIAGPDAAGHKAEMKSLCVDLSLQRVYWLGPVYGPKKAALFLESDLFVLPTYGENFGLVIAEALASELPVITTKNAPWAGLETHQCGWWIDLSAEALTEVLKTAMGLSSTTLSLMGSRGRAWMQRDFAWQAVAKELARVYLWILGGGSPPATVITD